MYFEVVCIEEKVQCVISVQNDEDNDNAGAVVYAI